MLKGSVKTGRSHLLKMVPRALERMGLTAEAQEMLLKKPPGPGARLSGTRGLPESSRGKDSWVAPSPGLTGAGQPSPWASFLHPTQQQGGCPDSASEAGLLGKVPRQGSHRTSLKGLRAPSAGSEQRGQTSEGESHSFIQQMFAEQLRAILAEVPCGFCRGRRNCGLAP